MDPADCHVVYVDKRASRERFEKKPSIASSFDTSSAGYGQEVGGVKENLDAILAVFDGVHVCLSGASCMAKLLELDERGKLDYAPTLLVIHIVTEPDVQARRNERSTPSPTSFFEPLSLPEQHVSSDIYGVSLLEHVAAKISTGEFSERVVPVAMIDDWGSREAARYASVSGRPPRSGAATYTRDGQLGPRMQPVDARARQVDAIQRLRYLEAGASDVVTSPLLEDRVSALVAHVYRAHKDASKHRALFATRKRSWVGLEDEENAVLREAMVENLMTSICKPETTLYKIDNRTLPSIHSVREDAIAEAVSRWDFSAHSLDEDELVYAAFLMLAHALQMPELEKWRLPADDLKTFLLACRAAYNGFVLYHNFRHVIDVLQAVFYFLLEIGLLPPYPPQTKTQFPAKPVSPIAALLTPFDALTLLISAIGHDVGHPGVNNAFLVALKTPLAQLYNDNSVLEAFHCAAYSQILRRYWNVAFEDTLLRQLLIKSILATDMGVHFKYMTDLGNLQEKLHHNGGTDGWSVAILEDYKSLACGLLIKCADISNVARPFGIAAKWTDILQDEFARQGEMEKKLGIPTTLFGGPPEIGNLTKLANSQIGFMNIFARPLFEAVTDILPGMQFAVDEIKANQRVWKAKIEEERSKGEGISEADKYRTEGFYSPRSGSPNRSYGSSPEFSHPEGLPASGSTPTLPVTVPMGTSQPTPERRRQHFSSPAASPSPGPNVPPEMSRSASSRDRYTDMDETKNSNVAVFQNRESNLRGFSNAPPSTNVLWTGLSARRSSGTVPTQLQLGVEPSPADPRTISSENSPPTRAANVDTLPRSAASSRPGGNSPADAVRPRNGTSQAGSSGGGGSRPHRGDKGFESENGSSTSFHGGTPHFSRPLSARRSTQQSSGRYSAPSNSDRYSNTTSGAQTLSSHFNATSPTETQATSFLTDGSDAENGDDAGSSLPEMADAERPGSGHYYGSGTNSEGDATTTDIKTTMPPSNGHVSGDRVVRKKTSSFLKRFEHWINKKPASP